MSACVYGCRGSFRTPATGPSSAIFPAYITQTRFAKCRAVARSCVMYKKATRSCSWMLRSSSKIETRTDASSIETGSSATMSSGLRIIARATATRWRWPPLSMWANLGSKISGGINLTEVRAFRTRSDRSAASPMWWTIRGSSKILKTVNAGLTLAYGS